jgi:hypothetical protein
MAGTSPAMTRERATVVFVQSPIQFSNSQVKNLRAVIASQQVGAKRRPVGSQ